MLLGDIVELARFFREVTASEPRVTVCAGLFELYRALVSVVSSSRLAVEHYLEVPIDAPFLQGSPTQSPEAKWATVTNADFKALERSVKAFVDRLQTLSAVLHIYDEDLAQRITFHFWIKSAWLEMFHRLYEAGHIDVPSKQMRRRSLRLATNSEIPTHYMSIASSTTLVERLETVEELDVSGPEAVSRLADAGRANIQELEAILKDIGAFIKAHCTIESLVDSTIVGL